MMDMYEVNFFFAIFFFTFCFVTFQRGLPDNRAERFRWTRLKCLGVDESTFLCTFISFHFISLFIFFVRFFPTLSRPNIIT